MAEIEPVDDAHAGLTGLLPMQTTGVLLQGAPPRHGHLMHAAAQRWLARELDAGWASCPVTQAGVLRILSQPAYPNHRPVAEVAERLAEACRHRSHRFWSGGVSLIGPAGVNWRQLLGHRQVTDAYLLAVAVAEGGRFVSFDQRISADFVPQARPDQLVVIEPE